MKYIDYPVDYSSGLPKIDIPIYTIRTGDLTLPISISYHSSGLKPSEDTGFIGLGWNLNYGGMISRIMKGYPDEKYYGNLIRNESEFTGSSNLLVADPYYSELFTTTNGINDTQYDIFYYSLPNQQGRFIFKRNHDYNLFKQPILLPYRPLKISPNDGFDYFDVVDGNGVYYRFGKSLKTACTETEDYRILSSLTSADDGISAWLLTEIISTNKADTISFEYEFVKKNDLTIRIEKAHRVFSKSFTDYLGGNTNGGTGDAITENQSISAYEYTTKRLKTVKFKKNELRFTYKSPYYPNSLLTKIEIFDKTSASVIQSIGLNQSKYHDSSGWINWDKLDFIQFYDQNSQPVKKYQFSYDSSMTFPNINDSYTKETYSIDFWGYYNGVWNNDLIPSNNLYLNNGISLISGTANRNANSNWSKLGMLTQIIYPEGGSVNFTYKGNKIGTTEVGGVCLDNIVTKTGNNQIKKTFNYSSAVGISNVSEIYYYSRSMSVGADNNVYATYTASSDLASNINLNDRPVIYGVVTEVLGDQTTNNGKIEHKYDTSILSGYLSPDFPLRPPQYPLTLVNWDTQPIDYFQKYYNYGDLFEDETTIYDSSNNKLKNVKRYYIHNKLNSIDGLIVSWLVRHYRYPEKNGYFRFSTYTIEQLSQKLDNVVTTEFDNNQQPTLVSTEDYLYNNYLLPISSKKVNSNGSITETKTKYPSDFTTDVYPSMTTLNMLNYPIEETTLVNNNITSSKLTTYKANGSGYVPDKVYSPETATPLASTSFKPFNGTTADPLYGKTPEYSFDSYDTSNGNPLKVLGKNGIYTYYVWAYNKTYPVAKIESSVNTNISITVDDAQLKKTTVYADIQADVAYLKGLLNSYLTNKDYQVTLFTYKPLVGMTSQTDPAERTTYYEYDDFGRLKLTKDLAGNILKKYEYHYAGQ